MISVASEKNISTAKKCDIAPFKVNGQSHIILQQLSCGTRSKVSFVSNPAQISLKHSSQLTNKTTMATSFVFIRHVFHCVLHVRLFTLLYFIMILLSIYIYNWIGNKFLQLTSPSPYKYINSINKTNQMTANVQAISIIISKLSKIMSN